MEYLNIENSNICEYLLRYLLRASLPPVIALYPSIYSTKDINMHCSVITFKNTILGTENKIYYQIRNGYVCFIKDNKREDSFICNNIYFDSNKVPSFGTIITDNIFIAASMGWNPVGGFIFDEHFSWVSFFSDRKDWSRLPWDVFKGQLIFYYLVEHSGLTEIEIWARAEQIMQLLKNAQVKDVIFIYYSKGSMVPMFMTSEQFMKNINEIQYSHTPAMLKLQDISPPRSYIVNPLILERTATLFHSSKNSDRTQLLLDLAIATSQGKHSVNSWSVSKACKVVYIHHNCDNIDFCNLVEQSMLSSSPSLKGCIHPPALPQNKINDDSVIHTLWPQATFQEYPQRIDLNKKCVERNFVYFTFCGTMSYGGFSHILNYIPGDTALLILDIPFLWSVIEYEKMWAVFNATLFQLRSNYAVLMGSEAYSPKMALKVNNLPFDKIIKLQRLTHEDPESTLLKLIPERTSTKNSNKSMAIMKSQGQVWKEYRSRKLSGNDLKKIISKNYSIINKNKKTAKQLALKLGVSESYIKKLKKDLNLTEDMPQRKPRNPHKKSNNLYVDPNDIKL